MQLQFVPYRGAAPSLQDLVAGQIDMMFDQAWNSLAQVRAGTIRAYAVTRPLAWPRRRTFRPSTRSGSPVSTQRYGTASGCPRPRPLQMVARLNAAAVDALADPTVRQRLADLGLEIPPREQQTAAALGALQKAEAEKWWPLVKAANLKVE